MCHGRKNYPVLLLLLFEGLIDRRVGQDPTNQKRVTAHHYYCGVLQYL
jgi:hypothetical protein